MKILNDVGIIISENMATIIGTESHEIVNIIIQEINQRKNGH